ncbi:hypothetical protein ACUW83_002301 [Staphylococcus hominis]
MSDYLTKLKSLNEDLEIIKSEKKELDELGAYIEPIKKKLDEADPNEIPIKEYNKIVVEYREFAEEYNQRAKVLNDLIAEVKGGK